MANPLELPSLVAGTAIGGAAVAAFEPALERPRQDAWHSVPNRLPEVGLLAALVAGGKIELTSAEDMAKRLGYDTGPFDSLVWLAQNRLDFPLMLRLWRLGAALPQYADPDANGLVDRTLAHEQLDWNYHPYLKALRLAELPGIGDVATGVVRGALPAPSYMPVTPPTTTTKVKRFPQVDIDPEHLAAALGYDPDMLHLMIARSGLSLAPGLAAQARFRDLLADDDFLLAIAEGDLRTEWAQTLLDVSREIPTLGQMMEHSLRGFESVDSAKTNAKRHGVEDADAQLVYDNLGRAPAVHGITTGLARGATYPSDYSVVPEPYKSAIQRSDIRPEFADIVYHDRYSYPSGFQIRSEAQAGHLTEPQTEEILLELGWKPEWATHFAQSWTGTGPAKADPHITKAQTQLWTATHKAYVAGEISRATATTALGAAGVAAGSIPAVLTVWDEERSLIRRQLTATQIKKAYTSQTTNPDTGVAWTLADAQTRLLELGYDQSDATTLLEE